MTSARRDWMRNDDFWEESVITVKIRTSCKEELCPLRFQQLLSSSVFVTWEKTMLNIWWVHYLKAYQNWLRQTVFASLNCGILTEQYCYFLKLVDSVLSKSLWYLTQILLHPSLLLGIVFRTHVRQVPFCWVSC